MTVLEAQMQVDYGLFLLKKYLEELNKSTSLIDATIDKACGYDRNKEIRDNTVEVLNSIIEAKTFLGCGCEGEKKMIEQIKIIGG